MVMYEHKVKDMTRNIWPMITTVVHNEEEKRHLEEVHHVYYPEQMNPSQVIEFIQKVSAFLQRRVTMWNNKLASARLVARDISAKLKKLSET